jgi:hypothetical protein
MRKYLSVRFESGRQTKISDRNSWGKIDERSCEKGVVFLLRDAPDPWSTVYREASERKERAQRLVDDVWSLAGRKVP